MEFKLGDFVAGESLGSGVYMAGYVVGIDGEFALIAYPKINSKKSSSKYIMPERILKTKADIVQTFKDFRRIEIRCGSEEAEADFFAVCEKLGVTWGSGAKASSGKCFYKYGDEVHYHYIFGHLSHCNNHFAQTPSTIDWRINL